MFNHINYFSIYCISKKSNLQLCYLSPRKNAGLNKSLLLPKLVGLAGCSGCVVGC
ncbi:unknown [[Mannheimia] succiniciproducens MBEL55E]|uniref:Uncharacterized protein n=1 Tax=Mannheimia succiniciproducens (strain KCTC 0769BP / MBEL55E) TaxID=221988 RepID=Q65RZ3_MANSM|nr:unknown [[Mannheimia] succiniciproducens MBEL55E]